MGAGGGGGGWRGGVRGGGQKRGSGLWLVEAALDHYLVEVK